MIVLLLEGCELPAEVKPDLVVSPEVWIVVHGINDSLCQVSDFLINVKYFNCWRLAVHHDYLLRTLSEVEAPNCLGIHRLELEDHGASTDLIKLYFFLLLSDHKGVESRWINLKLGGVLLNLNFASNITILDVEYVQESMLGESEDVVLRWVQAVIGDRPVCSIEWFYALSNLILTWVNDY
jgi:hypothetical protein